MIIDTGCKRQVLAEDIVFLDEDEIITSDKERYDSEISPRIVCRHNEDLVEIEMVNECRYETYIDPGYITMIRRVYKYGFHYFEIEILEIKKFIISDEDMRKISPKMMGYVNISRIEGISETLRSQG